MEAWLITAQEIYPDGHPSRYQPRPRGLRSTDENRCFALVLAVLGVGFGQSRSGRLITNSVYTWVSEWVSDTFAYRSARKKPVSTLRVSTSLKIGCLVTFPGVVKWRWSTLIRYRSLFYPQSKIVLIKGFFLFPFKSLSFKLSTNNDSARRTFQSTPAYTLGEKWL